MSESDIVDRIRASFSARGIWSLKVHGSASQSSGIPDIIGIVPPGRGFGIEVKVPGHAAKEKCLVGDCASPLQLYTLKQMAAAGAITGIAHSLQEAEAILERGAADVTTERT